MEGVTWGRFIGTMMRSTDGRFSIVRRRLGADPNKGSAYDLYCRRTHVANFNSLRAAQEKAAQMMDAE
jgi:hypothetical protein